MRRQLRAALAVGVGVETVQRLVLAVAPGPLVVVVDLVGGDVQHRAGRSALLLGQPHTFQQVDRTHNVRLIGVARVLVAVAHDGLRGQVQHNVGLRRVKSGLQRVKVADVADDAVHLVLDAGDGEKVRLRRRLQAVARDLGPGHQQHLAEPAALEAGVTGDEHPLAAVKFRIVMYHHQSSHFFQGALPVASIFSRTCFSRAVSMHCQKPLWI